jgi:hypothetical protein
VEIFESKTEGVSDTLVFAFETPGGFWLVLLAVFIALLLPVLVASIRPPSPHAFNCPPLAPDAFYSSF